MGKVEVLGSGDTLCWLLAVMDDTLCSLRCTYSGVLITSQTKLATY